MELLSPKPDIVFKSLFMAADSTDILSDFKERILFYWLKLYCCDLKEGELYRNLKQIISINILDFKMFDFEECHSVFHLREDRRNEILTDKRRFDFLEMPKAETDNSRRI